MANLEPPRFREIAWIIHYWKTNSRSAIWQGPNDAGHLVIVAEMKTLGEGLSRNEWSIQNLETAGGT